MRKTEISGNLRGGPLGGGNPPRLTTQPHPAKPPSPVLSSAESPGVPADSEQSCQFDWEVQRNFAGILARAKVCKTTILQHPRLKLAVCGTGVRY